MFTGAWTRSQKLGRRVVARVSSVEAHNFRFCRSEDDKAVLAARAALIQAGSQERSAARESSRSHCSRVMARAAAVGNRVPRFCRSVDEEAVMAARVPRTRSGSQNLRRRVEDFPITSGARGGACKSGLKPYFFRRRIGGRHGR